MSFYVLCVWKNFFPLVNLKVIICSLFLLLPTFIWASASYMTFFWKKNHLSTLNWKDSFFSIFFLVFVAVALWMDGWMDDDTIWLPLTEKAKPKIFINFNSWSNRFKFSYVGLQFAINGHTHREIERYTLGGNINFE